MNCLNLFRVSAAKEINTVSSNGGKYLIKVKSTSKLCSGGLTFTATANNGAPVIVDVTNKIHEYM